MDIAKIKLMKLEDGFWEKVFNLESVKEKLKNNNLYVYLPCTATWYEKNPLEGWYEDMNNAVGHVENIDLQNNILEISIIKDYFKNYENMVIAPVTSRVIPINNKNNTKSENIEFTGLDILFRNNI